MPTEAIVVDEVSLLSRLVPILGIAVLVGLCLLFSTNRKAALKRWDLLVWGLGLQLVFGMLILWTPPGKWLFQVLNDAFVAVVNATYAGADFVFGSLAKPYGTGSNFATVDYVHLSGEAAKSGADMPSTDDNYGGFVFAFNVLTTIIFFSALTSILYHLGILQKVVTLIAWVMQRTMRTSGAETLSASANIFVGQTEAPLVVRPYIGKMTNSELMTVMTGGFATVAGGVLAAYVGMLGEQIQNIAGHLLAASVMSAPAALLFGKLMVPETETPETLESLEIKVETDCANVLDAAATGTSEGVRLAINVGGMLIAFIAIIALVDLLLATPVSIYNEFGRLSSGEAHEAVANPEWLNLRTMIGWVFAPMAWLMGVTDWAEAQMVGQLMGIKMVANEFVAYSDLSKMAELSVRSKIIASYALAGFANFGSIGIQIGGLAVMAPERRKDLSRLALRAMFAGTFAANATACVAAILI